MITTIPQADSSDRELSDRVLLFLRQRQLLQGLKIRVDALAGTVTLDGAVRSYYRRQMLVTFTRKVAGVLRVIDELVVPQRLDRGDL
jgi:osmotically-inducible protein OsmY